MRQGGSHRPVRWVIVGILVAGAACAEAPTAPAREISVKGGRQNLVQLEPMQTTGKYCPMGYEMGFDDRCRESDSPYGFPVFDGLADGWTSGSGSSDYWPAPYGMDEAEYSRLSPAEKELVYFDNPPKWINRAEKMKQVRDSAINESQRLTNTNQDVDGSRQNAFQHALWSAKMAEAFGYQDAKMWTDAHEERPIPVGLSVDLFNSHKQMDLWNNSIGLSFAFQMAGDPAQNASQWVTARQGQLRCLPGVGDCPP